MCLLSILAPILTGCHEKGSGKPVLAVSFDSQKWLVEAIAGDDYEVVALLPQGSDPEMFDPDMHTMKALDRADAYLTTNTLGFETQVGRRIASNYPDLKIVDLTEGIDILMHTHQIAGMSVKGEDLECDLHDHDHDDHHSHPTGDPHIMSSLRNAGTIAKNILSSLRSLNPSRGAVYEERYEALSRNLSRNDSLADSLLRAAGARGGSFVVMHPSLSYFARDYDMIQIPLEVDGKEASPRQLKERLALAKESSPRALFYERGHNELQARQIAKSLGIEAFPVSLNGEDFVDEVMEVTYRISRGDGGKN